MANETPEIEILDNGLEYSNSEALEGINGIEYSKSTIIEPIDGMIVNKGFKILNPNFNSYDVHVAFCYEYSEIPTDETNNLGGILNDSLISLEAGD